MKMDTTTPRENNVYTSSTTISKENIFNGISSTANGIFTIGTSTSYNSIEGEITIESFEFKETKKGNFIEVVKRQKSVDNSWVNYSTYPLVDKVFKEIYGITRDENGKKTLKLLETINAKVTPGYYTEENIEFPE